jgi:hypothetical protein
MIRYSLLFGILLALATGCQPQAKDVAEETSQITVTGSAPKTAVECEQQLLALLANPVCSATIQAKQTERHKHLMRDFDSIEPQHPLNRLPRAQ